MFEIFSNARERFRTSPWLREPTNLAKKAGDHGHTVLVSRGPVHPSERSEVGYSGDGEEDEDCPSMGEVVRDESGIPSGGDCLGD